MPGQSRMPAHASAATEAPLDSTHRQHGHMQAMSNPDIAACTPPTKPPPELNRKMRDDAAHQPSSTTAATARHGRQHAPAQLPSSATTATARHPTQHARPPRRPSPRRPPPASRHRTRAAAPTNPRSRFSRHRPAQPEYAPAHIRTTKLSAKRRQHRPDEGDSHPRMAPHTQPDQPGLGSPTQPTTQAHCPDLCRLRIARRVGEGDRADHDGPSPGTRASPRARRAGTTSGGFQGDRCTRSRPGAAASRSIMA
jgi:hypothetical protein